MTALNSPLDFIVDGLATFRFQKLVREDKIMEPVREHIWKSHPPETTMLGYLTTCPWCLSMYSGLALSFGRMMAPRTTRALSYAFALSAVAGIMAEREESL